MAEVIDDTGRPRTVQPLDPEAAQAMMDVASEAGDAAARHGGAVAVLPCGQWAFLVRGRAVASYLPAGGYFSRPNRLIVGGVGPKLAAAMGVAVVASSAGARP